MIPVDGVIPMNKNPMLIYKIDSYCLGRVLYFLVYFYDNNKEYKCYSLDNNSRVKVNNIIKLLLENDVNKRITISECYNNLI